MRNILLCAALMLGAIQCSKGAALVLQFQNVSGAAVEFDGSTNTFYFPPGGSSTDFRIYNTINGAVGPGSAFGLLGTIEGTYTIGAITNVAPGIQSAPVTGTGTLTIIDAASSVLTATLEWVDIFTNGTNGSINVGGNVNLTGITYSGSNADLLNLANTGAGFGIATASFNFIPGKSLSQLTADGVIISTGYTGNLTPVPEPLFSGLLLVGGIGALIAFRRRGQRQPISE